jgi:penicillin-binding protein 1C
MARFVRLRRWLKWSALVTLGLSVLLVVGWWFLPRPELFSADAGFSRIVLDRQGRILHLTLTPDGKYRLPAKLDDLSPELIAATLEMEDRRYFSHWGTDPRSMARAAWGVVSRQRLGGGSTLTMQYARLRWKLDTRTVWGKLTQVFRAVQLERHYGKRELLEAYFTFAPYGGNVEGAQAASLLWCAKPARDLSLREAAPLSVLPQSPTALARLMARLRALRGEPPQALDAEFTLRPAPVPRLAPHFARRLLGAPDAPVVCPSTLDRTQQETVERSIADFLNRTHAQGLSNAAAILVHAPTREVRAYVGSAGFFNDRILGQVDGVIARRSPGSALKPFIYALAMDGGLIHPRTLLDDSPRRYGGYNPENSDRGFLGPLPAGEALRRSRNVPAVELLSRLPGSGLDGFLRHSGVRLDQPPGAYGLSLALGGAEVSLEDLAMLYASLASDGVPRPLLLQKTKLPAPTEPALLSPAARYLTIEALRAYDPQAPSGLAWKTGTSHGFRDAWACGMQGDWVLCVWVGNFAGEPMPGLFARETAARLLFQAATRLGLRATTVPAPSTVVQVPICAVSGELAGPHCPHCAPSPFIAGVSPIGVCSVHREVLLDAEGRRVTEESTTTHREVREFWAAHRLEQFRRAGLPRTEPPAWASGEHVAESGAAPEIVSPQARLTYVLRSGESGKNSIPLEAHAGPDVRQLHWFAGTQYLGASAPSRPLLWQPAPGHWTLQATDDAGRTSSVTIQVAAAP